LAFSYDIIIHSSHFGEETAEGAIAADVGGGSYQAAVNTTTLKSLQLGAFTIKASTSAMKGTPSFLRPEYQSNTS
jgi:hypothetical protein